MQESWVITNNVYTTGLVASAIPTDFTRVYVLTALTWGVWLNPTDIGVGTMRLTYHALSPSGMARGQDLEWTT